MFRFKQFVVDDAGAAMKVGTDAVLLGSWLTMENPSRILDIGTGSGILALMLAQRYKNAHITAVEKDPEAAACAKRNAQQSPWAERIVVIESDIVQFAQTQSMFFDLIVCNPPYFRQSLKTPIAPRNLARHDDDLPAGSLLAATSSLLASEGRAGLIFPYSDKDYWLNAAAQCGLFPLSALSVSTVCGHLAGRMLMAFSRAPGADFAQSHIDIQTMKGDYSADYRQLCRDFYLHF